MIKNCFTPYQTESSKNEDIKLTFIEMEIIRLSDIEFLSDKKAAKKMSMTVEDYKKLLINARKKIAIALLDGVVIKIIDKEDIKTEINTLCKFRCAICGEIYNINYLNDKIICPLCNSTKIMKNKEAGFCK